MKNKDKLINIILGVKDKPYTKKDQLTMLICYAILMGMGMTLIIAAAILPPSTIRLIGSGFVIIFAAEWALFEKKQEQLEELQEVDQ